MGEVRAIVCIKDYGTVAFVGGGTGAARCPISGKSSCVTCDVITANEAKTAKQVRNKKEN